MRKTNIGGQAVLEGVMMRSTNCMAVAVRRGDGEIEVRKENFYSIKERYSFLKWPVVRGIVTFFETMVLGIKALMISAELYGEDDRGEDYKPSKFESFIAEKTGRKLEDVVIFFAVIAALAFAVGLFVVIPALAVGFFRRWIESYFLINIVEGVIRLLIFVAYIFTVTRIRDIQRVFEYHGAEHKTIHCYEHEEELCVENARKYTTLHPRCGTAFLLVVMVVSILVYSVLTWQNVFVRILSRMLLLPLIAGISYEVIKWAGRSESPLVNIIMFPGLIMQKMTTREPDDSQLEVAIQAFTAVDGDKEEKRDNGTCKKDNGVVK